MGHHASSSACKAAREYTTLEHTRPFRCPVLSRVELRLVFGIQERQNDAGMQLPYIHTYVGSETDEKLLESVAHRLGRDMIHLCISIIQADSDRGNRLDDSMQVVITSRKLAAARLGPCLYYTSIPCPRRSTSTALAIQQPVHSSSKMQTAFEPT